MSAKGKGKGKMYSNNVPAQVPSSSTKLNEGALDNSYYVQAKMKDGKWEKAKIIECRLSKDYDSKQTKTEDSYDYYVHYENYNRRMDEWVNRDRIQMTEDLIQGDEIYRDTERRLSMFEIDGHLLRESLQYRSPSPFNKEKAMGNSLFQQVTLSLIEGKTGTSDKPLVDLSHH